MNHELSYETRRNLLEGSRLLKQAGFATFEASKGHETKI